MVYHWIVAIVYLNDCLVQPLDKQVFQPSNFLISAVVFIQTLRSGTIFVTPCPLWEGPEY